MVLTVGENGENGTSSSLKQIPVAGSSAMKYSEDNPDNKPMWRTISPSMFQVRSRDYLSTRIKIPCPDCLYDLVAVDCVTSNGRIPDFPSRVKFPEELIDKERKWHSPDIMVISFNMPKEASFYSSGKEGPGFTLVCYFQIKESTIAILKQLQSSGDVAEHNSIINGVKLFEEWCRVSPSDPAFQGRFKLIPKFSNLDEIGLPRYVKKVDNKPMLIKRSGVTGNFSTGHFEINFYPFPYLAKQGFSYILEHYVSKLDLSLGFLIEGRDEEELPEVLIGAFRFSEQDINLVMKEDEFFGNA